MILADTQLGVPSLFGTLLVVAVIAVAAPILVNLKPELRIPAVIVEVLLGALVGPGGLGLIHPDEATQVLSFLWVWASCCSSRVSRLIHTEPLRF